MVANEERKLRLSQFILAYPCNEAQQRQNWERLSQLFQQLDKIFEISSVDGDPNWRVSIKGLDAISAKQGFIGALFDKDGNPYDLSLTKEAQLYLSSTYEDVQPISYDRHYRISDDDDGMVAILGGADRPPAPPSTVIEEDVLHVYHDDEYYQSVIVSGGDVDLGPITDVSPP